MSRETPKKSLENLTREEHEAWLKGGDKALPAAKKIFDHIRIERIDGHHKISTHHRYDGGGMPPEPKVKIFAPDRGDEALMHVAKEARIKEPDEEETAPKGEGGADDDKEEEE